METNKTMFGLLSKSEDPYNELIGKYIKINVPNMNFCGVYIGTNNHDYAVLNPHLNSDSYPTGRDEKRTSILTLVDKPLFIPRSGIVAVSEIRESYVMSLIRMGREIIIPEKNN